MPAGNKEPHDEFRSFISQLEEKKIRLLAEHHNHVAEILEAHNGEKASPAIRAEIRAQRAAANEFRSFLKKLGDDHD